MGIVIVEPPPSEQRFLGGVTGPRPCFEVRFDNGETDWWPVYDSVAEYEFREAINIPPENVDHAEITIVYHQATVDSARLHFKDDPGLCAQVRMPWDPYAVFWCTLRQVHASPHEYQGGPSAWTTEKLS